MGWPGDAVEQRHLTHQQLLKMAFACGQHRLLALFLGYCGVRFGEAAALRVGQLDLVRRRAAVVESVTDVNGRLEWGTPKGHERREVPIPAFLVDQLTAHVAGKRADELVFTNSRGEPMRSQGFQRAALTRAASTVGVPGFHVHELRHTAASLGIAAGADIKVVQTMLGHKTATMTLDLYGHLFPDRLDDVAVALDEAARAVADVYPLCTRPEVVDLDAVR